MKIKNISCTQFAGIRDKDLSFDDGINLIYGKNESGKSTFVNLLSRTLFQNARIDGRRDREFKDLYFPGSRKGSSVRGDFADGKIIFEAESGTYTLTKGWGSDAQCMLSTPDGKIRDPKKIDTILKEVLLYGEGVYSDMLFSSQRNTDISLQTILDASKKTEAKQEVTNAVSQAFFESDGITADAIEQAIDKKIEEIAGKYWDTERCMPVRKAGRRTRGLGEILKAYYDLEDAKAVLEKIIQLEEAADSAAADYIVKENAVRKAEDAYDHFNTFAGRLEVQSERCKAIGRLKDDSRKYSKALSEWPQLTEAIKNATALKKEKEDRERLDKYGSAKKLVDEIADLRSRVDGQACPTDGEIAEVKAVQKKIMTAENRLCGMNLSAVIKMLGGNTVCITSLRTGQELDVSDDLVSITEAVKITVPGVMEMQLSPADVDVSEIETSITEQKTTINDIFSRYGVESLDGLEHLKKKVSDEKSEIDKHVDRLSRVLGGEDYAALESAVDAITGEVRSKESIEQDILAVCGGDDIVHYITVKETIVKSYADEYDSVDQLKEKAKKAKTELKDAQKSVEAEQDIPEEYADISNPSSYLKNLKDELRSKRDSRDKAMNVKTKAARDLENYKENLSSDPTEDVDNAERIFDEKKVLLGHWMHIAEVFAEQKQNVRDNPMQDISDSFTRYLGMISDGKISSEFPDLEKLNMSIYSGNSLLDYGKLSEGTKETVSLAFRLAVLDHLFPDGGGVIVFDDPFTDMDADRTAQSCELIKECATRHQVIFLTCKEEYADLLGVNEVRMSGV